MPEVLREGGRPKKLLTLVREAIRRRHMSGRTEESRVSGTRRYIYCHGKRHGGRHPATMGKPAAEGKVITSTRRSDREENSWTSRARGTSCRARTSTTVI